MIRNRAVVPYLARPHTLSHRVLVAGAEQLRLASTEGTAPKREKPRAVGSKPRAEQAEKTPTPEAAPATETTESTTENSAEKSSGFFGTFFNKKEAPEAASEASPKEETQSNAEQSAQQTESTEKPQTPPVKPGRFYNLIEDIKDVFAVTFGVERKRNVGLEYDAGLREYPWISYTEPVSGREMYKNNETGVVTENKPLDFDLRAPASSRNVAVNVDRSELIVSKPDATAWQRTIDALGSTPIIAALVDATEAVAASPVGDAARAVKQKVTDKVEDAREVWETSQHPLIVNASYVVDNVLSETEEGRAIREIKQLDSGFDQYTFVKEMQDSLIPTVASAFFRMDMPVLHKLCKDSALAQMNAVQAARDIEGLTMDGTILNVQRVEIATVKTLERGDMPIVLTTSQVQYIHAVKNKKGEVVEGGEDSIRAAFFVLAVTREFDPETGALEWRVVEMSMQGSMLYL